MADLNLKINRFYPENGIPDDKKSVFRSEKRVGR
jgi:hypothetical protein